MRWKTNMTTDTTFISHQSISKLFSIYTFLFLPFYLYQKANNRFSSDETDTPKSKRFIIRHGVQHSWAANSSEVSITTVLPTAMIPNAAKLIPHQARIMGCVMSIPVVLIPIKAMTINPPIPNAFVAATSHLRIFPPLGFDSSNES